MAFSRTTLSVSTVVVIVLLVAGGTWWRLRSDPEAEGEVASADAPVEVEGSATAFAADLPQAVTGREVVRDTLWITVNASGQAAAFRQVTLTSQVAGIVESIPVRESQQVPEGATLLQTDTLELVLARDEAEASLVSAEADFRARTLFDDEITDPAVRAQREAVARVASGLNQAEVALRRAQLDLERARVAAPYGGRVADLQVVEGQFVGSGVELMTLVDLDPIKVEVQVLEAELGYLQAGRRAIVTFAAFPGETFNGRIETINPVVDPERRTGRVTVLLSNPQGRIKPGMYAEVTIDAESFADRIIVPRSAVLERGEGTRRKIVFIYEGDEEAGRAKWQYVTTGEESESFIEIVPSEEGTLEPGQIVLVDGHYYLAHNTPIRLVENPALAGGRPGA
jgi:HlyD family secretion protein